MAGSTYEQERIDTGPAALALAVPMSGLMGHLVYGLVLGAGYQLLPVL